MKIKNIFNGLSVAVLGAAMLSACTDDIKFGNAFIEKAPGGAVNVDTVFSSPVYTQQFLNSLYARQYYGLPYANANGTPNSSNTYTGKFDALTDCYQLHWGSTKVENAYYTGNLTATDTPLMGFNGDYVWEVVRLAWMLIENINRVPGLSDQQKASMVAQAKCLIAERYFDLFPHYGGLPIIRQTYTGNEGSYEVKRGTVAETVDFMVGLLNEAIEGDNLVWAWNGNTPETNSTNVGRWTKAGAMALKAKILTFAASPLFNNDKPYYDGSTEAEQQHLVWYGDYQQSRWEDALQACEDFFKELKKNGYYGLRQATAKTPDAYRHAYRMGYIRDDSPEALHTTRVISIFGIQGTYCWLSWGWQQNGINRNNYTPTQEYVDMFPWKDGTPFDWDKDLAAGRIEGSSGRLFYKYTTDKYGVKKEASRDPRLYENAFVNGQQEQLGWEDGKSTGNVFEFWVGGYHALFNVMAEAKDKDGKPKKDENGNIIYEPVEATLTMCPTGYGNVKYLLDEQFHRKADNHWNVVTMPEMYLIYAECLAQAGRPLKDAIAQADVVRKRVGLGTITMGKPDAAKDKDALIEEILRERACELGLTNARFMDMIRYKRTDWMTKQLHGLGIFRMQQGSTGKWGRVMRPWLGDDKNSGTKEPSRFEYEKFELRQPVRRVLWGMDPEDKDVKKWLMSPFPQTEINKGYGLVQNPGW